MRQLFWEDGLPPDRATFQKQITAMAYAAFTLALSGRPSACALDASYNIQEDAARQAVRGEMQLGRLEIEDFEAAMLAALSRTAWEFPSAPEILIGFASDEVLSLTMEELGLLQPTSH